jgi:hypothetical protein
MTPENNDQAAALTLQLKLLQASRQLVNGIVKAVEYFALTPGETQFQFGLGRQLITVNVRLFNAGGGLLFEVETDRAVDEVAGDGYDLDLRTPNRFIKDMLVRVLPLSERVFSLRDNRNGFTFGTDRLD